MYEAGALNKAQKNMNWKIIICRKTENKAIQLNNIKQWAGPDVRKR